MQDRQGERSGFTRTGLRLTNHVVTGHDDRDRLLLNSRWLFVASRGDGCKNIRIKIKSGEAAGFPEKANFVGLKERGQLSSPADAAARLRAYLARPDFGANPVADVRDA